MGHWHHEPRNRRPCWLHQLPDLDVRMELRKRIPVYLFEDSIRTCARRPSPQVPAQVHEERNSDLLRVGSCSHRLRHLHGVQHHISDRLRVVHRAVHLRNPDRLHPDDGDLGWFL